MVYKDINENRVYQREWQRRKRLGISTKIKNGGKTKKLSDIERRVRRNNYRKKHRDGLCKQRDMIFGNKCWICHSEIRLCLHKKDGTPHRRGMKELYNAIKNPKGWVRLCGKCHDGGHFCMQRLGLSWNEIVKLYR